ncbi:MULTISPECIES: hypothetical protein [Xanthomonas]|uniref:Transmembrane protein n=3 Tax=Xanthomonas TaxID=338 RepID=A0AAJ3CBV0_XANCA|nr:MULTISPECIES: hypothetical protein [Xanthomonas]MCE4356150.1 hypothetical protein [Xanthomonas hortorum pv. pelargonii]MCM5526613.1 hypothetical protein [Xanthomonas hortorum pv. pelargonii]MCM5538587.1 hypothetical protein [Xanthomonas hortorum pv. pelargonii]MCM5542808.1 hypothetical protein [Xanthomonas hortorum pv. pelargonii]MCM5546970.1 hypothetical protein [Xanthomonas hortorum pv. pelargonii]
MTETTTYDGTRSLRRAAAAVAGLGIGVLVFAVLFAGPVFLENQLFLTLSLPVAVLMIFVGLAAYRFAKRAEVAKKPATAAEKAEANEAHVKLQNKLLFALKVGKVIAIALILVAAYLTFRSY